MDPKAALGSYGETPDMVRQRMADLGLVLNEAGQHRRDKVTGAAWMTWSSACEGEKRSGPLRLAASGRPNQLPYLAALSANFPAGGHR